VFTTQSRPWNPGAQAHLYEPSVFWQVAPFRQGAVNAHSSTSSLHSRPFQPIEHSHAKSRKLLDGEHLAPLRHLFGVHGSSRLWHSVPVNGNWHTHLYAFTRSMHEPPFLHGLMAQSSTFTSQLCPEYPGLHWHV